MADNATVNVGDRLTPEQVSPLLGGISPRAVRLAADKMFGKSAMVGGRWLLTPEQVEQLQDRPKVGRPRELLTEGRQAEIGAEILAAAREIDPLADPRDASEEDLARLFRQVRSLVSGPISRR